MKIKNKFELYIINDDYNTFNHVVKALVNICNLDINNAYTKTLKIHHEKKCLVSETDDEKNVLEMFHSLNEFGIMAEIIKNN